MLGSITTQHTIQCGGSGKPFAQYVCMQQDMVPGTFKSCKDYWKRTGWKYTKEYGWLCPECARALYETKRVKET